MGDVESGFRLLDSNSLLVMVWFGYHSEDDLMGFAQWMEDAFPASSRPGLSSHCLGVCCQIRCKQSILCYACPCPGEGVGNRIKVLRRPHFQTFFRVYWDGQDRLQRRSGGWSEIPSRMAAFLSHRFWPAWNGRSF